MEDFYEIDAYDINLCFQTCFIFSDYLLFEMKFENLFFLNTIQSDAILQYSCRFFLKIYLLLSFYLYFIYY